VKPTIELILTMRPALCAIIDRTTYLVSTIGATVLSATSRAISPSGIVASTPLVPSPALLTRP